MRLATGFAPVVEMLARSVPVSIGTDNSILNDTINPLSDARAVATAHKGFHRDTGVVSAQQAFDMVTLDAAKTIGKGDHLGSLEVGKQADLAIVNLDQPHLTPSPDPVHALVYGLQGFEIETVFCAGDVLMEDRELVHLDSSIGEIIGDANETAADIVERVGIS
jgi:atrazine chlorohydrolase/5-methylthioadenosine/S-adenosylhomocysteine deaminase